MAFQSIGFHAALILNKLRNEQEIRGASQSNQDHYERGKANEEAARRELAEVNKKLAALAARVEPPGGSGGN